MKKYIWVMLVCTVLPLSSVQGQQFKEKFKVKMDEVLTNPQAAWMSVDGDTLLDVVITGADQTGQLKLLSYQNVLGDDMLLKNSQLTGFKNGFFQLADWNGDNKVDILVAGTTLINTNALFVFENNSDFTFQKGPKILDHGSLFYMADFNNDGRLDFITSEPNGYPPALKIYKNDSPNFLMVYDSLGLIVSDVTIFDFNKDGKNDFVVSGLNESQQAATILYLNKGNFDFDIVALEDALQGTLSSNDVNADGSFDLYGVGSTNNGQYVNRIWQYESGSLSTYFSTSSIEPGQLFTGDFNSNGKIDQLIHGTKEYDLRTNYITYENNVQNALDTTGLLHQQVGDLDRDGDLDLLQIIDSVDQQWIKVYENLAPTNNRPAFPATAFAISTGDRTFLYWSTSNDDLTASPSLTYDVWLGNGNTTLVQPSFDLGHKRRLTTNHGNAGTNTALILNGPADDTYTYQIQTVDNAFNGSYGVCTGAIKPCFELAVEKISACENEELTLNTSATAYWFSSVKGFLGNFNELKLIVTGNDTLFSFFPQESDCSKNKVWLIYEQDQSQVDQQTIYACQDEVIRLGIAPGAENVEWGTNPAIYGADSIDFLATKDETILVTAKSEGGCTYRKQFNIKISKPVLQLNGETWQILKGNSVQLQITTSAKEIQWEPASWLSNASISNPIATPPQNAEYKVTVTDSLGCTHSGVVQILVEQTAFIPNLFTPNGDGQNDALLVYGLNQASSFRLQIFNREGSLVYETEDVNQATANGWNGSTGGALQPSGVYYWKVEGSYANGERLLLNGKKNGSVLLVY